MPRFAERITGWRSALADLERWLLPGACLLCEAPIAEREGDALICALCRSRWRGIPGPLCDRCGQPLFAELECRICSGWTPQLRRVRSAVWLEEGARRAVHRLKYEGWWRVAQVMANRMQGLEPLTGRVCLIPVPLGAARERERGYNQSERIASALGALIEAPVRCDVLRRVRETRTQTALAPEARQANLAGAFACAGAEGLTAVLVDDVFTTGATLVSAAAALAAAGADTVDGITFARATEPLAV
jgi:ComF family protein